MNRTPETSRRDLAFVLSLPERTLRAIAAGLGGLLYETTQVVLPGWLRRSRLYRAIVAGTLRIAIELVGGATGILPTDEITAQELAVRKAAGTGIEFAGLLAMGWSPLWLFAATADLTGGARTYLQALVSELRRDGLLPEDTDIASVEELLDTLEGTSGLAAESLDMPPLNVDEMRTSWQDLRQHATELPDADRLTDLYAELQQVAQQEGRSLRSVSSLIGAGALRAGVKTGQVHIFDYYRNALRTIAREGLPIYARRVTRPYLTVAKGHFDPKTITYTERLLRRAQEMTLEGFSMMDHNHVVVEPAVQQHTIVQSIVLHLPPGVFILVFFVIAAPLLDSLGAPSFLALLLAIALVLIPFELGYLLYQGKQKHGVLSLRGIVLYRQPMP